MVGMKLFVCSLMATVIAKAVGLCPDITVLHPRTAEPLQCQIHAGCMSATCDVNTTASSLDPPQPLTLTGSVSFRLDPCSSSIQLTLDGSLPSSTLGVFSNIPVTGLGQVEIEQADQVVGYLHVLGWSQQALYVALEAQVSNDRYPLFNATTVFNWTQLCATEQSNTNTVSTSKPQASPTMAPSGEPHRTTCEALQAIATSSSFCKVKPNSCQEMECNVLNDYRITLTILPCNTVPGVKVELYHLLDGMLLEGTFTDSHHQAVYSRESKILNLSITIEQPPQGNQITFQLEMAFPWGENLVVVPATLVPVGSTQCPVITTASFQQATGASLSHTEFILVTVMSVLFVVAVLLATAMIAGAAYTKCRERRSKEQEGLGFKTTDSINFYKNADFKLNDVDCVNLL